jgi:hypothetical protein
LVLARNQPSICHGNSLTHPFGWPVELQLYPSENKGINLTLMVDFALRKSGVRSTIRAVRRFFGFLQNDMSARLAAPLICMPAPGYALPRYSRVRVNGDAQRPGGKKSSPRPLPQDWNPDGMEQKPFELRQQAMAEGHRVRRRSNRSLRAFHKNEPARKNDAPSLLNPQEHAQHG